MPARLHEAILAAVVAELRDRPSWDEPPALYRLHVTSGRPRLIAVGIPAATWGVGGYRPPDVLRVMAETFRDHRAHMPPGLTDQLTDLHGMAFRHEAWQVDTEPGDDAGREALDEMARDHTLYTHPDRIEIRLICAVDRAGITYYAQQPRGGEATGMIRYPGRRDEAITGAVPESLDIMTAALTGIPAQARLSDDDLPGWLKGQSS